MSLFLLAAHSILENTPGWILTFIKGKVWKFYMSDCPYTSSTYLRFIHTFAADSVPSCLYMHCRHKHTSGQIFEKLPVVSSTIMRSARAKCCINKEISVRFAWSQCITEFTQSRSRAFLRGDAPESSSHHARFFVVVILNISKRFHQCHYL